MADEMQNSLTKTDSNHIYLVTNSNEIERLNEMSFTDFTFAQIFFCIYNPKPKVEGNEHLNINQNRFYTNSEEFMT